VIDRFVPDDYVPIVCEPTGIVPERPTISRKDELRMRREAARRRAGTATPTVDAACVTTSFFRENKQGGRTFRDVVSSSD
jgi:hypothetical protein